MRKPVCGLVLFGGILFLGAVSAEAGGFYLGGGIQSASFAGDLRRGKYVDLYARPGLALDAGYEMSPKLALDLRLGLSLHPEDLSGRDVTYRWAEFGPRFTFLSLGSWNFFAYGGVGTYQLRFYGGTYFPEGKLEGEGTFAGIGLEEFAWDKHSVRLTGQGSFWKTDPFDLDAQSFAVGLIYNYHF